MTTKLRTGLLLGFTAMIAATTLSGCFIETTSSGPGPGSTTCADNRFFNVYWSVADNAAAPTYSCDQTPPFSIVRLLTNSGSLEVGRACQAKNYMGFLFDWQGSTATALPVGTYVISADLMATDTITSLSAAPGPGAQYAIPSCAPVELAFTFDLH